VCTWIEREIADFQATAPRGRGWPARKCAKARQKLGEGKRLCEVIVGAGVESLHYVRHRIARRKHQNRSCVSRLAQATRHLCSFNARQHPIENNHVKLIGFGEFERSNAVMREADDVVLLLETLLQKVRHAAVVFDDKNSH
jgi:hypothetical protein